MKKEWSKPSITDLSVKETMYGGNPTSEHDGPYVEIDGEKYWPHES